MLGKALSHRVGGSGWDVGQLSQRSRGCWGGALGGRAFVGRGTASALSSLCNLGQALDFLLPALLVPNVCVLQRALRVSDTFEFKIATIS